MGPPGPFGSCCGGARTRGRGCAAADGPQKRTKGSFLVEVALWLLFCLPGVIYSIWRLTSKTLICPSCENEKTMIPASSPAARQYLPRGGGGERG